MSTYMMCDLKLVRFLQMYEPLMQVVKESSEVSGYEMYIVEQWACDRKHTSCIICFTGNPKHKVTVDVVALPTESKLWTPATQTSFDELFKAHARPKETDLGIIYVSNLSSFPSNLNLVPVPGGNIRQLGDLFAINENLRRTGCGGRLVLSLQMPSNASEDKFRQLFKTHENVPTDFAVRELVTLVQIGLYYCSLLAPRYVDGLLCNETLKAINMWWDRWGVPKYHTRPSSSEYNLLSSRSVAGIIGFVTGVRNRLAAIVGSSKVPKDPFDVDFFRESLRHFQKHEHLPRSMCIDEATIKKLYSQTEKATNTDFFGIVKSTMKEVSGKTYQGGITDVETLGIDRLRNHLQGSRARYLWLGRGERRPPILRPTPDMIKLGIPIESLSPSELTSSTDFKWTDIARRKAKTKKDQYASPTRESSMHQRTDSLLEPGLGVQDDGYIDELSDDNKPHAHRLRNLRTTMGTKHLRKYMGRSPYRREDGYEEGEIGESEDEDFYLAGDISDATTDEESAPRAQSQSQSQSLSQEELPESSGSGTGGPDEVYDVDLTSELRRRHSIDIGQVILMNKTSLNDPNATSQQPTHPSFKFTTLRRSPSFSIFEDYFLDWTVPWAIPASVMASHYRTAMELQTRVQKQTWRMDKQRSEYHVLTRRLVNRVEADKKRADEFKEEIKTILKREGALNVALTEVEANAARLQYETRMLDAKMRDVEEAVETFVGKVNKLEDRVKVLVFEMVKSTAGDNKEKAQAEGGQLCKELAQPTPEQLAQFAAEFNELDPAEPETWYETIKQFIGL